MFWFVDLAEPIGILNHVSFDLSLFTGLHSLKMNLSLQTATPQHTREIDFKIRTSKFGLNDSDLIKVHSGFINQAKDEKKSSSFKMKPN